MATGGRREGDPEWAARVGLHRERRPGAWRTEETCEVAELPSTCRRGRHRSPSPSSSRRWRRARCSGGRRSDRRSASARPPEPW
ncbi:hypothetical protein ACFWF3_19560 [Nocardia sp. NPDC060220]|uniref:hypothetical protein n=1 Tax=Nocardia sp. NPDC060220 TaxID=3347076 RepID=UPI0036467E9E